MNTITIEQSHESMLGLYNGDCSPSLLQALCNAALSKHMPFPCNVAYAQAIRAYRRGLPVSYELNSTLKNARLASGKPAYGLTRGHVLTLQEIEYEMLRGNIDYDIGETLQEQRAWRRRVIRTWGVGDKVASWALTILDPSACKLVAIDTIHCARLGIDQRRLRKSPNGHAFYEDAEDFILDECDIQYPDYPVASVAAWLWFNQRGSLVAHDDLSCRKGS